MPDDADWRAGGFGVYVHWPFCAAKCPYCDFNSHVRRSVDAARWGSALEIEIRRAADETGPRRVDTIFFGGGTPSLMPPETVAATLEAIRGAWDVTPDAEITLEANPTSSEAAKFRSFADAGVNRLSLGVQALDDADLRALGRMHDVTEARRAFDLARSAFGRVSFDLIYARQGQTLAAWRSELAEALSMAVDHLSLYQLTIEPETRFGELAALGRLRGLPDDDLSADMFAATQELCEAAGFPAYEISNHARSGAEGRHNLVYWRYGDYAGIGPGAHGRLTLNGARYATETIRNPEGWLTAVERQGSGESARTVIPAEEQGTEMLLTGLRLREGVSLERFETVTGRPIKTQRIENAVRDGFLRVAHGRVAATAVGRPVLDALLRDLLS